MRRIATILLLGCSIWLNAQTVQHEVQAGETIYGISRKYGVSESELINANPILEEGLKLGQVITIPSVKPKQSAQAIDTNKYDIHVVQAGETLFGLSNQYGISQDQLLKDNPELSDGLRVGQKIRIPKSGRKPSADNPNQLSKGQEFHMVMPGETIYSLCKSANIDEEYFYALNPEVKKEGLKAGAYVVLPTSLKTTGNIPTKIDSVVKPSVTPEVKTEDTKEQKESKYKVVRIADDETWESLQKKYGAEKARIIKLNPETMNGLKPGSYIIVPNITAAETTAVNEGFKPFKSKDVRLASLDAKTIRIGVALPFYLMENDSIELEGGYGIYSKSQLGMEFYSGLRHAIDSLARYGLNVEIVTFDTRNEVAKMNTLANDIRKANVKMVIGPLYSSNAEALAKLLPEVTIVSPLSKTINNASLPNLVGAVSGPLEEVRALANYINKSRLNDNVILVARDNEKCRKSVSEFKSFIQASNNRTVREVWVKNGIIDKGRITTSLAAGKKDIVVVLDDDAVFTADLINKLISLHDTSIQLMSTNKILRLTTLESRHLNTLKLIVAETDFVDYGHPDTDAYLAAYRAKYNTEPSRFAMQGFDVGMYFLPILALDEVGNPSWPPTRGVIKGNTFMKYSGQGPRNSSVFVLMLKNYQWIKVN